MGETETLFEEVAENYTNFIKNVNSWIQKAQQTPNSSNIKKITLRHIIVKFLKLMPKRKSKSQPGRKRYIMYRDINLRIIAGFSS